MKPLYILNQFIFFYCECRIFLNHQQLFHDLEKKCEAESIENSWEDGMDGMDAMQSYYRFVLSLPGSQSGANLTAQNRYSRRLRDTPLKTNQSPENQWLEDGRCNFLLK